MARVSLRTLLFALLLGLLVLFRFAVVQSFHAPGGDGVQYHRLTQELLRSGRFAWGPRPMPPTYTRLPGYPLFLAYVAVRSPLPLDAHVLRATEVNVLLDLATALVVFCLVRRRWGASAGLCGAVLVLTSPLLLMMCCHALTEPLATLLTTLQIGSALMVMETEDDRARLGWAVAVGVAAGAGQLVRGDTIALLLPTALAFFWARRRRLQAGLAALAVAAALFLPWPLRNLRTFRRAYPFTISLRDQSGNEVPQALTNWERTWSSNARGQSFMDIVFVWGAYGDPKRPGIVLPAMYDSPEERAKVVRLFERFNRRHWTPDLIADMEAMAEERAHRAPFRTYVWLPFLRATKLWIPIPPYEMSMPVRWLGSPRPLGPLYHVIDTLLIVAALFGGGLLFRAGGSERRLVLIIAAAVLLRTALVGYALPVAGHARLRVELIPLLTILGVYPGLWLARRGARRRLGRDVEEEGRVAVR